MVLLKAAAGTAIVYLGQTSKNWSYRDDIGAFWGIKGYEE